MDGAGQHLACLFCTQKCYSTHGEGKPVGPTVPAFCKIMTESVITKDSSCAFLELPTAFVRQYRNELCKTAVLEGPSGQTWSVDVTGSECVMNFRNGWKAFCLDHDLHEGDIVLFKLTTKAYFRVEVFDKDGCEKDLYGAQNSAAFDLQNETASSKKRKKRIQLKNNIPGCINRHLKLDKVASTCRLVGGKKFSLDSEFGLDNKGGLKYTPCVDIARSKNNKKLKSFLLKELSEVNSVVPHDCDPDCDDMNLLQDLIMRYKITNASNCQKELVGSSSVPIISLKQVSIIDSYKRKIVSGKKHSCENGKGSKARLVGKNFSCVRIVSDAVAATKSHNSRNPTIIMEMKRSHVAVGFSIHLERKFAREWLPLDDTDVILVDSTGCRWKVKFLWRRAIFSGGWKGFSCDHGLQEKDICLFEMTSQTPYVFIVHMFRQP